MKRFATIICVVLMLCTLIPAAPIYKYEDTVPITDTVSLTNVREFHADHNISYSYIKMDLTDERVKLKLLTSDGGTDVLSYMSELAKTDENTVAALNGDFFSVYSGKKGFSLGIEKKDGTVLQSPINPDTMATIAYNGSDVLMTYLDFHVFAVAENWEYKEIRHVNKHTSYYGDLLMYTHEFNGGYSPAPGGDVVEVVVEDGVVTEFRRDMDPCKIPENGCVLVLSEGSSMFLKDNFDVGSKIKFDWYFTPDLEGFDTAFGGGSMLVYEGKDVGKVGDYTHTVAGFNPRSAIGIDEKGETLYLVAVDGRQESSRGMRMSHLAELLIELGCHTAVNLDGGGSTRMLSSTLWESEMHPVNNPTENRRVINAIGIVLDKGGNEEEVAEDESETDEASESDVLFDNEPHDEDVIDEEVSELELSDKDLTEQEETNESEEQKTEKQEPEETAWEDIVGIKIRPLKDSSFVGEKTEFEIVAHDENLRQVYFNEADLELSVSEGEIEDGCVVSNSGGTVTISATLGEHYAETSVYYIDSISGIVTDSVLYMKKGDEREIPISVFDYYGRFVNVENTDAFEIVSSDERVVSVNGNKLVAENNGKAIISVTKDGMTSFISIAIGTFSVDYHNNFEMPTGRFTSYPEETKGGFELSGDYYLSGNLSGKLSFDFTQSSAEEVVETEEETKTEQVTETEETAETDKTTEPVTDSETNTVLDAVTDAETVQNMPQNDPDTAILAEEKTDDISRAVYFSLNKNVVFEENSDLKINVYCKNDFHHEVRAQLIDSDGRIKNVKFNGDIVAGQWNELTLDVPDNLKAPVSLSRVYVLYTPGEEKDAGSIYIDDMSMTSSVDYVPEITSGNVYRYNVNNSDADTSVKISAVSAPSGNNLATVFENTRIEKTVLSENGIVISERFEKTVSEDDNAVYVHLDTSNGGIRSTDSSQWELLLQAVELSKRKNLFIITNDSIFGNDEFENQVVKDYLSSLEKNVFVVSSGKYANYANINGVRYFTLDSTPVTEFSFIGGRRRNTVEFYFGTTVTFEFKSI